MCVIEFALFCANLRHFEVLESVKYDYGSHKSSRKKQ